MSDFTLSLQITALGMGLVFGAILLLWLMMVILTFLTAEKEPPPEDDASRFASPDPASVPETGFKAQAAAIAVALALAEQGLSSAHPLPEPPTAYVSAWQLGMRTSQRSQKGNFRRR
jgi:Na+-transporting methylmalonyl-CoA/oxaloacetate decarboxylase gamma subunit